MPMYSLTPHWSPYLRLCWVVPLTHPPYLQVKMACAQRVDPHIDRVTGVRPSSQCGAASVQHLRAVWCTWALPESPFATWPRVRYHWRNGIAFCPDHAHPSCYHEAVVSYVTYGWVQMGDQVADDTVPEGEAFSVDVGLLASAHPHLF